jgi:hypothetical protein
MLSALSTKRHSHISRFGAALFLLIVAGTAAWCQVAGGTILGSVTDPSGSALQSASVKIKDAEIGLVRTVETGSNGLYAIPNLQPGNYEVVVSAAGFSDAAVHVTVAVGSQQVVNVGLKLAAVRQEVSVADTAPALDLGTSGVAEQVSSETVRGLPLNGRDWTQLGILEPGVSTVRNQASVGSNGSSDATKATRGFGTQLAVSGARSAQNNFRLDGISFNDYTNDAPGGVMGSQAGVDAIEEFSVLTSDYSAEYGKTSGGVINAITRNGTNDFHGDVYEFFRNSALDARNFFDQSIPPFRRNQFGGAAGGAIRKNKTFWFFNYEGLRQELSLTQISSVPSAGARNGILSTGNVTVDPTVKKFLGFYPLPNAGLAPGGDTGFYSSASLQNGTTNFVTGRIDQTFSDNDKLSVTGLFDRSELTQPDQLNNDLFRHRLARPFGSLEETHVFSPRFVNSIRVGFNRDSAIAAPNEAVNPLAADTTLGSVPGRPAATISVPGLARFWGGTGGFPNFTFGWNSYQFYDDAFVTRGAHSIKLGLALERMQSNNLFHFTENGGFSFGSLAAFLTNQPTSFSSSVVSSASPRGLRETLLAGYVQDDWRIARNLTLNLGLRYEVTTVPTEVEGKLSVLRNITDSTAHIGSPYFSNPTLHDFEPRVGFAYDPFHNGKSVLRGGFGIYDVLPLPYEFLRISSGAAPFNETVAARGLPAGAFPYQAYTLGLANLNPGSLDGQRVTYIQQNPSRSYVLQWHLQIQREIARGTTATIGYAGSRGVHLPYGTDDINIVMPTKTAQGYLWPSPAGSGTLLNPNVGMINSLTWGADSYYHALQAQATVKPARRLQFQASYTWGKSIDTGSSTLAGDQYLNSPSTLPLWFDPSTRRGVSDFNIGQSFVLSGIWEVPNPAGFGGFSHWALSGWQVGGIFQAGSGAPFSVLTGGDPQGLNSTDPWAYPNRLAGAGCGSLTNPGNPEHYIKTECFVAANPLTLGNAGRNTLTGPGLINLDAALFKNSHVARLGESFNVQFRVEAFNLLNHTNFAAPLATNTLFNQDGSVIGDAGALTSTQTPSRQLQLGIKIIW